MKKFLILTISVFLIASSTAFAFEDTSGHSNEDAIDYLKDINVVQGYSDGTYRPDNPINRAEFLKIIFESLGVPVLLTSNCFPDVQNEWFASYVCYAKDVGMVSGYPDGYFKPANNINLAEALKIIVEAYEPPADPINDDYLNWYEPYYFFMEERGLLASINTDLSHELTRGEMAQLISNYHNFLDDPNPEPTPIPRDPTPEPEPTRLGLCYDSECTSKNPDYMIITRPLFIDTLQDFIDWKTEQGFDVGILTVDYIDSIGGQSNPVENMREVIKDYTQNHSTEYFVLVGDSSVGGTPSPENMYDLSLEWNVPSGNLCNASVDEFGEECADDWQVTDLYFADFDDDVWVKREGGYYVGWRTVNGSEFTDYPSLDFETIVARIPIREPEEFENIFYKMRNFTPTDKYDFHSGMIEEVFYCRLTDGFDSYDQAALHGREGCRNNPGIVRDLLEANGVDFEHQFFDIFDEDLGQYNETQKSLAKDAVLEQQDIIKTNYHGGVTSIEIMGTHDVHDFEHIFPAWIVESCNISAFANLHESDSLSEALIKAEKGPAFILNLPSEYAFVESSLQGKTVGEAFYRVGESVLMVRSANSILFGDPSLRIFE